MFLGWRIEAQSIQKEANDLSKVLHITFLPKALCLPTGQERRAARSLL
jgi:hypothetical protein